VSLNSCSHKSVIWLWHSLMVLTKFYCHNVTQMWTWVICKTTANIHVILKTKLSNS
jgi:hypothetical protein